MSWIRDKITKTGLTVADIPHISRTSPATTAMSYQSTTDPSAACFAAVVVMKAGWPVEAIFSGKHLHSLRGMISTAALGPQESRVRPATV